jgi:hypothetical protein
MFYEYNQNNSGGSFIMDEDVAHFVIIEARSDEAADAIAESIGIYFNGADDDGPDCPCCGSRWHSAYGDGDEVPSIYGRPATQYGDQRTGKDTTRCMWTPIGEPYAYVYYADGRKESLINGPPNEPVKVVIGSH